MAVALHLAVTASVWADPARGLTSPDSAEYLTIANNLAAGHGFSQSSAPPYAPDLRRTPVYPGILAALFHITGSSVRAAIALNTCLGLLTIALVSTWMARHWGTRAGAAAGWLLATDPASLTYHHLVLSETTFALLLVSAVVLLAGGGRTRWLIAAAAGATLGISALCRPIGLYLALALLPAFGLDRGRRPWPQRIRSYVILNLVCATVLGVWVLRNAAVFGAPVLTSQGSVNLYFHRAAYVEAAIEGTEVDVVRERWTREMDARGAGWTDADRAAWLSTNGRAIVAAHPFIYARVYAVALAKMFAPERDEVFSLLGVPPASGLGRAILGITWVQLACFYGCVVLGAARMFRGGPAQGLLAIAATVVAYFVVISGPEVYARFRMPLMPVLALVGAFAFVPVVRIRGLVPAES